jgi:FixJ family two-component response regulator
VSAIPVILYVIDDDSEVRRALARLLRSAGYTTRSFASASEFLVSGEARFCAGCIILDLAMPGLNGFELQEYLSSSGCRRPIIFLTGNGDISKSVRAMKAGAVNFLTKPVDEHELLRAVEEALKVDATGRAFWNTRHSVAERLATLTHRERQVFEHVVAGRLNKQIAADLGLVEQTIKVHRARMMQKMHAASLVELMQLASLVGIEARSAQTHLEPARESNIQSSSEPEYGNC